MVEAGESHKSPRTRAVCWKQNLIHCAGLMFPALGSLSGAFLSRKATLIFPELVPFPEPFVEPAGILLLGERDTRSTVTTTYIEMTVSCFTRKKHPEITYSLYGVKYHFQPRLESMDPTWGPKNGILSQEPLRHPWHGTNC